jgi:predicted 2-oxoglutarate/Fe(II)-dependent dioxygenase YbiX
MPSSDLFTRLGLFVGEDFLDSSLRERVLLETRSATRKYAEVYTEQNREQLDESARRANKIKPSGSVRRLLEERLDALRPQLERAFGIPLGGFQAPQLLAYGPGDFHEAHVDTRPDAAEDVAQRKISAIIGLNDRSEKPRKGSYGGGSLVLQGLVPGLGDDRRGFAAPLSAGSILAFKSNVVHEVKPVTHGERYTIVTWFY